MIQAVSDCKIEKLSTHNIVDLIDRNIVCLVLTSVHWNIYMWRHLGEPALWGSKQWFLISDFFTQIFIQRLFLIVQKARYVFSADAHIWQKSSERAVSDQRLNLFLFVPPWVGFAMIRPTLLGTGRSDGPMSLHRHKTNWRHIKIKKRTVNNWVGLFWDASGGSLQENNFYTMAYLKK